LYFDGEIPRCIVAWFWPMGEIEGFVHHGEILRWPTALCFAASGHLDTGSDEYGCMDLERDRLRGINLISVFVCMVCLRSKKESRVWI
jgi:hypothetical protein